MKKNTFKEIILLGLAIYFICTMIGSTSDIIKESQRTKCIKTGCNNESATGSCYCWLHKSSSSVHSSSYNAGSSSGNSTKNSYSSGSSSKKNYSGYDSYDAGYDSVYFDEDYDWDRYWSDSDYADGVDDAMDDLGW